MARFEVIITATDAGFTTTMRAAQAEMNATAIKTQALKTAMSGLRQYTMVGAASLAAMILPTVLASKAVGDFDATLRRIVSIGGAEFVGKSQELTDSIMDLSSAYGIAFEDIAEGILQFTKAGFQYNDIIKNLITPTAQLAIVNQTDFTTATEISTVAWTIFGETLAAQGKNATDMMQEMYTAANISLLEVEDLASALEYAGSAMAIASIPFEQFLALFSVLSQVGYKSGQNVRTLIQRLMVPNEAMLRLDDLLGEDGIIEMGVVNLDRLMTVLGKTETLSGEALQALVEAMGVRSTGAFMSAFKAGGLWEQMLKQISTEEGTLASASDNMAESITSAWQRIRTAFMKSLTDQKIIQGMSKALNSLVESMSSGPLGETIANVLMMSINYLITEGPELITMLSQLLSSLTSLMPTLMGVAQNFTSFLKTISGISPQIIQLVGALYLLNRVMPLSVFKTQYMGQALANLSARYEANAQNVWMNTQSLEAYDKAITVNSAKLMGMNAALTAVAMGGMLAVSLGMTAFIGAKDGFTRAAAGIVMAAGMMAAMFFQLAVAQAAAANAPIPLVGWIAMGVTIAAIIAGAALAAKVAADQRAEARRMAAEAEGYAKGGLVKKSGIGYIHAGEIVAPETEMAIVSRNYNIPLQYSHARGGSVAVEGLGYVHEDEAIIGDKKSKKKPIGKAKYVSKEGWTYLEAKEIIVPKNRVQQLQDVTQSWNPSKQYEITQNTFTSLKIPKVAISGPKAASIKTITLPVLKSVVNNKTLKEIKRERDRELINDYVSERIFNRLEKQTSDKERKSFSRSAVNRIIKQEINKEATTSGMDTTNLVSILASSITERNSFSNRISDLYIKERETTGSIIDKSSRDFLKTVSEKIDTRRENVYRYQEKDQESVSKLVSEINLMKRLESKDRFSERYFGYETGGTVKTSGVAYVHRDEMIVPGRNETGVREMGYKIQFIPTDNEYSAPPPFTSRYVVIKRQPITENIYESSVIKVLPLNSQSVYNNRVNSVQSVSENVVEKEYQHREGGLVEKTGWGYLHEKEYIISRENMASVQKKEMEKYYIPTISKVQTILRENIKATDSFKKIIIQNSEIVDKQQNVSKELSSITNNTKAVSSSLKATTTNISAGGVPVRQPEIDWDSYGYKPDLSMKKWIMNNEVFYKQMIAQYAATNSYVEKISSGVRVYTPTELELTGNKTDYDLLETPGGDTRLGSPNDKQSYSPTVYGSLQHFWDTLGNSVDTLSDWMGLDDMKGLKKIQNWFDKLLGGEGGGGGAPSNLYSITTNALSKINVNNISSSLTNTISDSVSNVLNNAFSAVGGTNITSKYLGKDTGLIMKPTSSIATILPISETSMPTAGGIAPLDWKASLSLHMADLALASAKTTTNTTTQSKVATTTNTENIANNYDNRIVNLYSVKEEDLQRIFARSGRWQ